jgi:hypothetical protein
VLVRKTAHDVNLGQLAQGHERLDRGEYVPTILNRVTRTKLAVVVNDVSVHLIYSVLGQFDKSAYADIEGSCQTKNAAFGNYPKLP